MEREPRPDPVVAGELAIAPHEHASRVARERVLHARRGDVPGDVLWAGKEVIVVMIGPIALEERRVRPVAVAQPFVGEHAAIERDGGDIGARRGERGEGIRSWRTLGPERVRRVRCQSRATGPRPVRARMHAPRDWRTAPCPA